MPTTSGNKGLCAFVCIALLGGALLRTATAQQAPQYVEVSAGATDGDGKNVTIPAGAICTLNRYAPSGSLGACVLSANGDGSWQLMAKADSNGSLTCGALCTYNVTIYRPSFPAITTYTGSDYRKVMVTASDTPFCGFSHMEQTGQFGGSCALELDLSGWMMTINSLGGEPVTCGVVCYDTPDGFRLHASAAAHGRKSNLRLRSAVSIVADADADSESSQGAKAGAAGKAGAGSGLVTCGAMCLDQHIGNDSSSDCELFQQLVSDSQIFTLTPSSGVDHAPQFAHCALAATEFLGTMAASCQVGWNDQAKTWVLAIENN